MKNFARTLASAGLLLCALGAQAHFVSGANGFFWDIDNANGVIGDGTNDAYDGAYRLSVNGQEVVAAGTVSADGRTLYLATEMAGLRVTRTVYVPTGLRVSGADYLRYVDCVENTGTSTVAGVTLALQTNLGSDGGTLTYPLPAGLRGALGTDDGDGFGDPSLVHLYGTHTQDMTLSEDALSWSFLTPAVKAGKKYCYRTYAIQATTRALASELAQSLSSNPDVDGMTAVERKSLQNASDFSAQLEVFPPRGAVLPAGTSFDVATIISAPASVLSAYTLSAKLNGVDVSAACRSTQALVDASGAITGHAVRCTGLSSQLVTGTNDMVFQVRAGKESAKAHVFWQVLPVQSAAR
ncbi:hypothetical protein [Ideonella livida]|uniref:Uncharacterized protein n=1 Tax=Ideonella livida TaxID=2707176 RepID=A0A7C9PI87_9BURK|nr:hypothetical protein [Ideonella livida]NDY92468.1 hypothetical protein [Ideonella livida]